MEDNGMQTADNNVRWVSITSFCLAMCGLLIWPVANMTTLTVKGNVAVMGALLFRPDMGVFSVTVRIFALIAMKRGHKLQGLAIAAIVASTIQLLDCMFTVLAVMTGYYHQ